MREKKFRTVISFDTTTDAMAFEAYCARKGLPGRLIPVPTSITAGCGLAWMAGAEDRGVLESAIKEGGIRIAALHEIVH